MAKTSKPKKESVDVAAEYQRMQKKKKILQDVKSALDKECDLFLIIDDGKNTNVWRAWGQTNSLMGILATQLIRQGLETNVLQDVNRILESVIKVGK